MGYLDIFEDPLAPMAATANDKDGLPQMQRNAPAVAPRLNIVVETPPKVSLKPSSLSKVGRSDVSTVVETAAGMAIAIISQKENL